MKVLVTGRAIPQQPDRCTGQQLAEGFRQAGHDCTFCGNFYGEFHRWLGFEEATQKVFDLVVVTEMNDGGPAYTHLFDHIGLEDVPRLYWDFDASYHSAASFERAGRIKYDGYLVGNKLWWNAFAMQFGKPAMHLPYACSPQIHRKLTNVSKSYLLGFIGSMTAERKRLVEMCKQTTYNSADVFAGEGIYGDDLVARTNSFRMMFHNNQNACKGLVPGRPWETAACGTTLLMDRTSYEDFIEFLPEYLHEDLLVYNNDTDIHRILTAYKYHGHASLEMSGAALQSYVHANHSYKNRAERIIEWTMQEKILSL